MRLTVLTAAAAVMIAAVAPPASAEAAFSLVPAPHAKHPWRVSWAPAAPAPTAPAVRFDLPPDAALDSDGGQAAPRRRVVAIEYSDGYRLRQRIHKYASFAMLPLFGAELAVGQSLYNSSANAGGKRSAHAALGSAIGALFAVNTVTGVWNMFGEGRKDPNGRTLRLVHGLLMMAADVGFLATAASGPSSEDGREALRFEGDKVTHRNIAIASMSIGTVGYLIMLVGNR